MKALLCPYSHVLPWCEEVFPGSSIASLPVIGKPLAMHWIDLLSQVSVSAVRILDYEFDGHLQRFLNGGQRWNLEVDYQGAGLGNGVREVLGHNAGFLEGGDAWIVYGAVLPRLERLDCLESDLVRVGEGEMREDGLYLLRSGVLYQSQVPLCRLDTLLRYYEGNFELLQHSGVYVFPGYSSENGIHLGMNVVLERGCSVKSPVVMGDNVSLGSGCQVSGGVILGHDVLVGHNTDLRGSLVMEHTYVGSDMELRHKIVRGSRIVDPVSGEYVDYLGFGLVRGLRQADGGFWCNLTEYVLAFLLAIGFFLPWLFFLILELVWRKTLWGYKWGMDRYPKFWLVLLWRHHLIKRESQDRHYVFQFSEAFAYGRTPEQRHLDDCYFANVRSVGLVFSVILHCLTNRWFANDFSHV